jgi:hypothetical protein
MRRLILLLAASANFAAVAPAHAGLVISFQSPVTLVAGSSMPVDIVVSISGEAVSEIDLAFKITRDPGNAISPTYLPEFVTPSSPAIDPTFNDPHYIFGASSAFGGASVFGVASDPGSTGFNNTFTGGDFSLDDAIPIRPQNTVLARLQVNASGILNPTNSGPDGDRFVISIDLANSSFYGVLGPISDVTAATGAINVMAQGSGNSIPEPTSVIGLTLGLIGIACLHLKIAPDPAGPRNPSEQSHASESGL